MRELDEVAKRIETSRPSDVQCARFLGSVEKRNAPRSNLHEQRVQVRAVCVSDQLLDLGP
jgi:hypothetical protein